MKKLTAALLLLAVVAQAKDPFYVYVDKMDKSNHFCPSGYMGDYGDIKIDEGDMSKPHSGKTAIKVVYTAERKQGAGWAGIFWQNPCNNWGTRDGGYNLNDYSKVTFWAKGTRDKAGNLPRIEEFKIGGITGEYPDSASTSIGPIDLTEDWKQYTIPLRDMELSKISGGFCWSATSDYNQEGFTFFLDDIVYQ